MRGSTVELVMVVLAAGLAVLALAGCTGGSGGGGSPAVRASWTLTPGVLNPAVTQATIRTTICRSGYTREIRPPVDYTNALKASGLKAYHLHGPLSAFQEDHLISLELGGNPTDPRNLWPEPYPRAAEVDKVENELNAKICSGALTLEQAQHEESAVKHRDG